MRDIKKSRYRGREDSGGGRFGEKKPVVRFTRLVLRNLNVDSHFQKCGEAERVEMKVIKGKCWR